MLRVSNEQKHCEERSNESVGCSGQPLGLLYYGLDSEWGSQTHLLRYHSCAGGLCPQHRMCCSARSPEHGIWLHIPTYAVSCADGHTSSPHRGPGGTRPSQSRDGAGTCDRPHFRRSYWQSAAGWRPWSGRGGDYTLACISYYTSGMRYRRSFAETRSPEHQNISIQQPPRRMMKHIGCTGPPGEPTQQLLTCIVTCSSSTKLSSMTWHCCTSLRERPFGADLLAAYGLKGGESPSSGTPTTLHSRTRRRASMVPSGSHGTG